MTDEQTMGVKDAERDELGWLREFYKRFTRSREQGNAPRMGEPLLGYDLIVYVAPPGGGTPIPWSAAKRRR